MILDAERAKELWHYRELLYFFAWRDIKVRYKQAALGAAWAIIQPLFTMLIFTLFFGRLANMPTNGVPYPLFSYCALMPWTYFSGVLAQGANSLVANSNLVTKIYFPRVLLPASSALAGLLDFAVSAACMVGLILYYKVRVAWTLALLPFFILAMVALTLGVSMLLAAVNVRYRDVKYAVPFVIQLWLFVTPVIYPSSLVPERFRYLIALNPCWGIVEGFRTCLVPGMSADAGLLGLSLAVTVAIFVLGATYFHKTEETFADVI